MRTLFFLVYIAGVLWVIDAFALNGQNTAAMLEQAHHVRYYVDVWLDRQWRSLHDG